jgi:hypothetical protein
LVKDEYARLAPQARFLCDEVVLALAWKKAHAYVRRHNWYADMLELDCSAVDLESRVQSWAAELGQGTYRTRPARMVPAPKNARWAFHPNLPDGWAPVADADLDQPDKAPSTERLRLRPLAHVGIREQAIATAVMLCLADCVETAQGDPAAEEMAAWMSGIYSYGNRLYCQWRTEPAIASFSWGSADTYSRYFRDYQQFVKRPRKVAELLEESNRGRDTSIYIVKLDLSSFFDCIDIERLLATLKAEYSRFRKLDKSREADDGKFWQLARHALTFGWSEADVDKAELLKHSRLPRGLPQGLVSSGFFANAYLLPFDRAVGGAAQAATLLQDGTSGVGLHDYCRYVDDLRLVVSVSGQTSDAALAKAVTDWVQAALDEVLEQDSASEGRLIVNENKTEVEGVSRVAGATSIAMRMRDMQQQLSGPFDLSSLEQLETGLHGLLSMAELSSRSAGSIDGEGVPNLAHMVKMPLDVRDDTLTRFAAYRLCKSLRHRRLLMNLDGVRDDDRRVGDVLLQDYELAARRLIAAWSENPSLVQVLRYAFDLFPAPPLLHDVLDALAKKLVDEAQHPDQAAVAWYVLAEISRAAAIETGRATQPDDAQIIGYIHEYRGRLAVEAVNVLQAGEAPWFVQQQTALLLATLGQPSDELTHVAELSRYRMLHAYLKGKVLVEGATANEAIGIAIVGYTLRGDARHFARWFKQFAAKRSRDAVRRGLELVYLGCPELFDRIARPGQGSLVEEPGLLSAELAQYVDASAVGPDEVLPEGEWISLARAVAHPSKVFQQENALLHLGICLTELSEDAWEAGTPASTFDLRVKCDGWGALNNPNVRVLEVKAVRSRSPAGKLFRTPAWCKPEAAWMYAIGQILRAAAVGRNDYTISARLGLSEPGWYRGLSSTALKRRLGMLHLSQALGGTASAVTPWFSNLLSVLLRWPGIADEDRPHEAEAARSPADLRSLLETRREYQATLYGKSSGSAIYRYPVQWVPRKEGKLRVAVLQGLLPAMSDFSDDFTDIEAASYRRRHRNHTATLLRLAAAKISAHDGVHGSPHKPRVDLVVLPEYSVHALDEDLLRAFSDDTGAMLHCGLVGMREPRLGAPTNVARWVIPVRTRTKRSWIAVDQGKMHLTDDERDLGVVAWCPYRVVVDLQLPAGTSYRMAGAICYDATDLALAADLKNETHMFVVPALNKDVKTFDSMVSALRYHMYQHVVIANSGEFGGSTAQAPYDEEFRRVISHSHGSDQISIGIFEVDLDHFGPSLLALSPPVATTAKKRLGKTPPAALDRR